MLLGVGKQGKAALYDLAHSEQVTEILAADKDIAALRSHVREKGYDNVRCAYVDAADPNSLHSLMADQPDVVDIQNCFALVPIEPHAEAHHLAEVHLGNPNHLGQGEFTTDLFVLRDSEDCQSGS